MPRLCLLITLVSLILITAAWSAPQSVYFKAANGQWLPLPATSESGTVSFTLDPSQIKSGSTMIILDLPQGIKLDDERPPVMTGLKLDGRPLKDNAVIDLDWLPAPPQTLLIAMADGENPLDADSLVVKVNDTVLTREQAQLRADSTGRNGRLELSIGDLLARQGRFANRIEWRIADQSPQRNVTSRALTYRCLGEVKDSPTLLVESSYAGYEKLEVLTDGKMMAPGETTYGSTWASEEVPGDHWVVIAWPQAQELKGIEVFWANFQGVFHAPQELLVQTWDGTKWNTLTSLHEVPATRSTTISFPPLKSTRVRLLQPSGMGHIVRPNIMWITEIKVL
jgi:hypothetical protein